MGEVSDFRSEPRSDIVRVYGFCTEHSSKSRGIGYQTECSPTLRGGVTPAILSVSKETATDLLTTETDIE